MLDGPEWTTRQAPVRECKPVAVRRYPGTDSGAYGLGLQPGFHTPLWIIPLESDTRAENPRRDARAAADDAGGVGFSPGDRAAQRPRLSAARFCSAPA